MRRLAIRPHHIEKDPGGGNRTRPWWTAYETAVPSRAPPRTEAAAAGLEPAHSCLLDKRSGFRLSYAARMDREGLEPSQEVCKTSMQPLHHQPLRTIAEAGIEPATCGL